MSFLNTAAYPQSFTRTTANYTQPSASQTVTLTVDSSSWSGMAIGSNVFVQGGGHYSVAAVPSGSSVTLRRNSDNLSAPTGSVITAGAVVAAGGAANMYSATSLAAAVNALDVLVYDQFAIARTSDINLPLVPVYNADIASGAVAMHQTTGGAVGTVADYWMVGNFTNTGNSGARFTVPIGGLASGATITEIRARIYPYPASGTNIPSTMPRLDVYTNDSSGNGILIGTVTDASASKAVYESSHELILAGLSVAAGERSIFATISTGQGSLIGGTKILGLVVSVV